MVGAGDVGKASAGVARDSNTVPNAAAGIDYSRVEGRPGALRTTVMQNLICARAALSAHDLVAKMSAAGNSSAADVHSTSEQLVVFVVGADPEPSDGAGGFDANGSVVFADASDPKAAHFLEMEGRVPVAVTPQPISLVSQLPGLGWQGMVPGPEPAGGPGVHSGKGRVLPARSSSRAPWPSLSSLPERMSASICRSQSSDSYSRSQRPSSKTSAGGSL